MSKPWKQIKIFTCDAEQSVTIEPNSERDGVCIHSNEETDREFKSFCLHASYDEALAIANELIDFVNKNKEEIGGQVVELRLPLIEIINPSTDNNNQNKEDGK